MGNLPTIAPRSVKAASGILRRPRPHLHPQERQSSPALSSIDFAWQLSRLFFQFKATWFFLGALIVSLLTLRLQPEATMQPPPLPAVTATSAPVPLRPTFVLFGDSITQQSFQPGGWGAALANRYARKADVVLRGYSGYNTRWALYLLERVFPREGPVPALVTVFFGANDAALPGRGSQRQHVPIPEYQSNLRAILGHLRAVSPSTHVILIAPPPVDEASRIVHQRNTYGDLATGITERTNVVTGQYAEACASVGQELGIPVLDMWRFVQEVPDWPTSCLSDGLHLTAQGNQVVFEGIMRIIESEPRSPSLVFDDLPWDFPEHSNVDGADPKVTFEGKDSALTNEM